MNEETAIALVVCTVIICMTVLCALGKISW